MWLERVGGGRGGWCGGGWRLGLKEWGLFEWLEGMVGGLGNWGVGDYFLGMGVGVWSMGYFCLVVVLVWFGWLKRR